MWAGILKCADCGRAMHKKYCKNKSGTVYEYYICGTYRKKSNKLCTKHTKEKEIEKIGNLKRCLYEDWKNEYITKEEYIEYKQKYEQDIEKIKEIMDNLDKQKEKQEEIINGNSLWIKKFKAHKNITELDRDIITELIDYIEVHENKKITIHFNFIDEHIK